MTPKSLLAAVTLVVGMHVGRAALNADPLPWDKPTRRLQAYWDSKGRWNFDWRCQNDYDCNNLGTCDLITGRCGCHVTYHGQRCELKRCPVAKLNGKVCAGHGACVETNRKLLQLQTPHNDAGIQYAQGTCSCDVGWTGAACEIRECRNHCAKGMRREGTCHPHASEFGKHLTFDHDQYSTCECYPGSYGKNCEFRRCPVSPRGLECDTGHIPDGVGAHGHLPSTTVFGTCNRKTGHCLCKPGNYGPACEFRICPGEQRNLFYHGSDRDHHDISTSYTTHIQYAQHDTTTSLNSQLAQTKARGLLWARDFESKNHIFAGDYTRLRGSVRGLGNLMGINKVSNGETWGMERPANAFNIDVTKACWQQGTCDRTTGQCTCFEGFHGADCSMRHCPNSTRGFICDNAGTCDYTSGECRCAATVITPAFQFVKPYGKDCSLRTCPLINGYECDREGTCDSTTGLCKCHPGRHGVGCQLRTCPRSQTFLQGYQQIIDIYKQTTTDGTKDAGFGIECNSKGTCDHNTGLCECQHGWYGKDCSLSYCPEHMGKVCNDEGSCHNSPTGNFGFRNCTCNPGFYGEACQFRRCPFALDVGNELECAGHGTCHSNTGQCECQAGFYGKDCRFKTCPEYNGRPCNLNGKCIKHDLGAQEFGDIEGFNNRGDGEDLVIGPDGRGRGWDQNNHGFPMRQRWSGSAQGRCICANGYYGKACEFHTCPVSKDRKLQCDGHGRCYKETGTCKCQYGYSGADCSVGSCPEWHNRVCNHQGECRKAGTIGGTLSAHDHANSIGYSRDADLEHNPFDSAFNRGYSVADTTNAALATDLGYCMCKPPYYGRSCEKKRCPVSVNRQLECDGNGYCDTRMGICQCKYLWYGKDCSFKRCPEFNGRVCNLNGDCISSDTRRVNLMVNSAITIPNPEGQATDNPGTCRCRYPFFGSMCELKRCPVAWSSNVQQGDGAPSWMQAGPHDEMSDDYARGLDFPKLTEACSGHGACNYTTGMCNCYNGYHGMACQSKECPQVDGHECNRQGKCITEHTSTPKQGTCECTFPYYGEACQYKRCPTSRKRPAVFPWGMANSEHTHFQVSKSAVPVWGYECDGHGTCNQHTGRCTCDHLYYGESCEMKECPLVNGVTCNNQGWCKKDDQADANIGTCVCNWPYFGVDCAKKHCPASESNSDHSWHGMHRAQECDGHGACNYDTGRCNCDHGYGGLDCAIKKGLCPISNKNRQLEYRVCNGEGTCNHQTGNCHCFSEEFSGLDCSYRRCPFYPDVNGLECNGHGDCIQGFDERGQWTGMCKCIDGWSGKMCHEHYSSATKAQSTPPISFWTAPHSKPQGAYITNPRKHVILGSEGYTEGRLGGNQGGMDTNIAHNFQGKVGSYQSPQTSIRSADYNAGQHPINVPCGKLQTTGCQHSVTHPEIYTGNAYNNPTAQPSGPNNFDKVGISGQDWRMGDSVSTSYKTPVKQNWAAPYHSYGPSHHTADKMHEQGHDSVAAYSGHAGHQFTMNVDRQILTDVGADT